MSALGSAAEITNVKRSIEKYLRDNLYTTEGYAIDFDGLPFEESRFAQWYRPRVLDYRVMDTFRSGSSTQYAENVNALLQIDIFVKKSGATLADKHYLMRDTACKYFKIGQTINIYENTSGATTTVAEKMKVRRITNDLPISETNELKQYVLAFEIDYTKLTTKP